MSRYSRLFASQHAFLLSNSWNARVIFVLTICLIFLLRVHLTTADVLESKLRLNEIPPAFKVLDCTGAAKGKSLCYRCQYVGRPVVAIFARDVNQPLSSFLTKLEAVLEKKQAQKMAAFVVFLSDDPESLKLKLEKLATDLHLKQIPLTIYRGLKGPEKYKLDQDAEITIMMWNRKIKYNQAFKKGEFHREKVDQTIQLTKNIFK